MNFTATKQDFGEGWRDLIENAVPMGSGPKTAQSRLAHAWLLAPHLAAA